MNSRATNCEASTLGRLRFNDLARRISKEELRCEEESGSHPDSLNGLPEGLDELDSDYSPDELRARGWEL